MIDTDTLNQENIKIKVKDYTRQPYEDVDEEDFHIRTIHDEKLVDSFAGLDDNSELNKSMFNIGDADDLPDSDRSLNCQAQGISYDQCYGRDL